MINATMSNKTNNKEPEFFKTRSLFVMGIFYLLQIVSILSILATPILSVFLLLFIVIAAKDSIDGISQTFPWYYPKMVAVIALLALASVVIVATKIIGKYFVSKEIQKFLNWSENIHDIKLQKNYLRISKHSEMVDFVFFNFGEEQSFVDQQDVSHTFRKQGKHIVLANSIVNSIPVESKSSTSKTFYEDILENINVQSLLKCLSVDDKTTLRYVTRTTKVLSQFKLTADQEHILMQSCKELTVLDRSVSNLIHVEQVESNMTTVSEILNIICDNVTQVEKVKTSELISLLHSKQSVIIERKNRDFFEEQSSEQLIKVSTYRICDGDIDTLSLPW